MIAFFPTPYHDEHFYSIAARYHLRSGNRTAAQTMTQLFGKKYPPSKTSLPCDLDKLTAKLPKDSLNTADVIIQKHSFFPLLRIFLDYKYITSLKRELLNTRYYSNIKGAHNLLFYAGVKHTYLKFCPVCIEEETKTNGEAYWHRSHQFQGVRVCHKHEVWLSATKMCWLLGDCYHLLIPNLDIMWQRRVDLCSDATYQYHLTFSKMIYSLLNTITGHTTETLIANLYWYRAKQLFPNMFSSSKAYDKSPIKSFIGNAEKFASKVRSYFNYDFATHLNCHNCIYSHNAWFTRSNPSGLKHRHPIFHLLMMMFLNLSIDDLASITEQELPENYFIKTYQAVT